MARHVAENLIDYNGVEFQAGTLLVGIPAELLASWVASGTATVLENMEPSLQDTQAVWAAFAVEQGLFDMEYAEILSKEELVAAFMALGDDDAVDTPEETESETSDEPPAGDDPEDDGSDEDGSPGGDTDDTDTDESSEGEEE